TRSDRDWSSDVCSSDLTPSLLRKTQRIRERSRGFFELFPPRDGRFSFLRNEREAFLEQNREAYDSLATALKSMEAEFAALTAKQIGRASCRERVWETGS